MSYGAYSGTDESWIGILDRDEKVLWQGRPANHLRLEYRSPIEGLAALFLVGFSIFWMNGARNAQARSPDAPDDFWMFGLLFFFLGLYQLIGVHLWRAFVRSKTHYALTNHRALIRTRVFGQRKLKSYPINDATVLTFEEGSVISIYFAEEAFFGRNTRYTIPVGFEMIESARQVYEIMRRVQKGDA